MPALLTRMLMPPSSLYCALHGRNRRFRVGAVSLDCKRLHAECLRRSHRFVGLVGFADICQRHVSAFDGQTLCDGRSHTTAAAGYQRPFVFKSMIHPNSP